MGKLLIGGHSSSLSIFIEQKQQLQPRGAHGAAPAFRPGLPLWAILYQQGYVSSFPIEPAWSYGLPAHGHKRAELPELQRHLFQLILQMR